MQAVRTDCDIRNFPRKLRTVANRDADIRCGKCRRVVDSVTDHDYPASGLFFLLDKVCLVLRQNFRMVFVHADLFCDRRCCSLAVASHHDDSFKTGTL